MSTSNTAIAMPGAPAAPAIRAHGCQISFARTPPDAKATAAAEQAQQRRNIEQDVQRRCEKQAQSLRAEQRKRCACCETRLRQTFQTMDREIRQQLIALSVRIAEIIVRRELPDTDMLQQVLSDTLEPISDLRGVRVRIAPGDAANLHGGMPNASKQYPGIDWVEDASLSAGDLLVESRNGYFDGRIRERLAFLAEALEKSADQQTQPNP